MIKNSIPEELKSIPRWIVHKKKVPKNPKTGKNLTGGLAKWGVSFDEAYKSLGKYGLDGLGFVFTKDDNFCGIDIDKCVINNVINEKAKSIIDMCKSYTEYSPSKTGVHIIVKNENNEKVLYKKAGVEVYTEDRYFTVSGFRINETEKINTVNLKDLLNKISNNGSKSPVSGPMNNNQIISLVNEIKSSVSGEKFSLLWSGDWEEYDSHSEADMALCSIVARWVKDPVQIDQVFRLSKLFRPEKWDRSVGQGKNYGQATIEKVLLHEEKTTINNFVIEIDDLSKLEMPEIKTIMSPWLTFGSTHMIYAVRGAGKTFFALSLSLAVTHGAGFGEWELEEAVNTMYVDGEMLPQHIKNRIAGIKSNLSAKEKNWYMLSSGLNLQNGGSAVNIAKPHWQSFIYDEIISKDIKLLFLDNISALTPGIEENESTSWDAIASWVNKIKQTGCAVVFVHHAGKGGQQRGTSAREDALDTIIYLKKTSTEASGGVNVDIIFEKSRHIAGFAVAAVNFKLLSEPGSDALLWNINAPGVSKRDMTVRMLCEGKSHVDIGKDLEISKSMVAKYKKMAIEKNWIKEEGKVITLTNVGKMIVNNESVKYDF